MRQAERIHRFTSVLWEWYARHKRTLPWRDMAKTDPEERAYRVLVSEVMLQQTQVRRVQIVFKRFLLLFPTLDALANASNGDVIMAWRGMGYNSRALRLRDACRTVAIQYNGRFPREMSELRAIKGLGPYTAAAVRNFAFNLPTPCIDTNIRRILHRTFVGPECADGTGERDDRFLLALAEEVLEQALIPLRHPELVEGRSSTVVRQAHHDVRRDAANWHAALMDFGSLVQTKRSPKWEICPLTVAGIMKTTKTSFERSAVSSKRSKPREPGREMGGRFIPNRIFRGRIVEALRDAPKGLTLEEIGSEICLDWSDEHRIWLDKLINKLVHDCLIARKGQLWQLAS